MVYFFAVGRRVGCHPNGHHDDDLVLAPKRRRRSTMTGEQRIVADVRHLPDAAFGSASLGWWGTAGFMLIEGTAFVLAAGVYFYLMPMQSAWPPASPPPGLFYGTLFTVIVFLSEIPNVLLKRACERSDVAATRWLLCGMCLLGLILMVVRGYEFTTLNEHWGTNAYGSIVWALLMLHTVHIATDLYDSLVLAVIVLLDKPDQRRLGDVSDNALYWHFVALSWVGIYVLLYIVPRLGRAA
jgi:heme/copper-type cytochrome/quinol oxidase subunit 3